MTRESNTPEGWSLRLVPDGGGLAIEMYPRPLRGERSAAMPGIVIRRGVTEREADEYHAGTTSLAMLAGLDDRAEVRS